MEKREEEEERIDDGEETDEEKERGGWAHEAFGGVSLPLSLSFSLFLDVWSRVLVMRFASFSRLKNCARARRRGRARLHISFACVCVCMSTELCVCVYNNIYNNKN